MLGENITFLILNTLLLFQNIIIQKNSLFRNKEACAWWNVPVKYFKLCHDFGIWKFTQFSYSKKIPQIVKYFAGALHQA